MPRDSPSRDWPVIGAGVVIALGIVLFGATRGGAPPNAEPAVLDTRSTTGAECPTYEITSADGVDLYNGALPATWIESQVVDGVVFDSGNFREFRSNSGVSVRQPTHIRQPSCVTE